MRAFPLSNTDHTLCDRKMNRQNSLQNKENRDWTLDLRLREEKKAAADLELCRILLRDEQRFPWLILVPRREGVSESFDLVAQDRTLLWDEIDRVAATFKAITQAKKINIASFGNMVPQLHIHIVARQENDPAWPGSAIGWDKPSPYPAEAPSFWSDLLSRLDLKER